MDLKTFWSHIRKSSDRYIVMNAEGDPEFVIIPYRKFAEEMEAPPSEAGPGSAEKEILFSAKVSEIDDLEVRETRDLGPWDAMMGTLGMHTGEGEQKKQESGEPSAEPQFQFEPVDDRP